MGYAATAKTSPLTRRAAVLLTSGTALAVVFLLWQRFPTGHSSPRPSEYGPQTVPDRGSLFAEEFASSRPSASQFRDRIVAAVPADFPPTYSKDLKTGKASGFAIDVMDAVAERVGLRVEYVFGKAWEGIHAMVLDGRADVIPNLVVNESRKKLFIFTEEVETLNINFVARASDPENTGLKPGRRVGFMAGSTAQEYLAAHTEIVLVPYASLQHLMMDLLAGQLDLILVPTPNVMRLALEAGIEDRFRIIEPPIQEGKRAMALRPSDEALRDRLNSAIGQFIHTPEYQAIYTKWWGKPKPYWTAMHVFALLGSMLVIVTAASLVWRYRSLAGLNRQLVAAISDLETSRQALRESEERWQFALEGPGDGVWDWNLDTNKVHFSRQWKVMLGFEEHEIGDTLDEWDKRVHPEDREPVYAELNRHLEGESPVYVSEHRVRCKDGTYKWILDRGRIISRTADGKPQRMIGTHGDITERKRADEALREGEERYRALFSTMKEGFALHEIICDENERPVDYRYLDVNPAFEQITGIPRASWIGRTVREVIPSIEDFWIETYGNVALTGKSAHMERYVAELDRYYEIAAYCPKYRHFAVITTDITARKRAEEHLEVFHKITEHSGLGCGWATPDGRIAYVNPALCRMLGEAKPGDAVGKRFPEYYAREYQDKLREKVLPEVLDRGQWTGELALVSRDGTITPTLENFTVIKDADGKPLYLADVITDLTERKRAEEEILRYRDRLEDLVEERTRELDKSREQLQRAQRLASIGTLAAGIAHEINNPLGMMRLSMDVVMDSMDKPDVLAELLRQQKQDIERCSRIVKGVLDFARQGSTRKWPLDLNEIVRHGMDFTREYVQTHGTEIEARLATERCAVLGNATELEQVVVNLVHNAVQACSAHGHVTIETCLKGEKVCLEVSDNGCGMTPEQIEHAFDPFFTTRMEKGGTGLGLSTVHGIVTSHGGNIGISSKPGMGAVVTIDFPRHAETEGGYGENSGR